MTMALSADLVARIEKALPARLAWELAKAIATDPITDREFIEEVLANLEGAWRAPFLGLPEEAWRPELDRSQNIVLGGFIGRSIVTPLYLVALLNQDLLDSRVWTYPDNGGYDLGYNTLVRRLLDDGEAHGSSNNTLIDRCGATARKHARRARQRLMAAGFYLTPLRSAA